ncbi:MAG: phospholipid carrier-dependent glycosyltransferase, partial [Chloroflexi bacterium]
MLALLPRALSLQAFVTADEAKWVYRSARFLAAFLQGDLPGTTVNLTPAVTTTWLGSAGLAVYYRLHQAVLQPAFVDWLASLPPFRTELDILAATRWPMALLTALAVVLVYHLGRRLVDPPVAWLAAALLALDPHFTALSRILGHDAPAAVFMTLSLLWVLPVVLSPDPRPAGGVRLVLSGVMAGLAVLSKAPALFLLPFVGLLVAVRVWRRRTDLAFWTRQYLVWLVAAWLAFVILWPAAWVDPLGRPLAVVQNAFLSATDQAEADAEGYWLVPDLGPAYYLVHTAFKLSPLVMVGAGVAVVFLFRKPRQEDSPAVGWLLLFALLFAVFMTLGDKRSPRYILPVFPALSLVAAWGWARLFRQVYGPEAGRKFAVFAAVLVLSAGAILLPYAPYYFSYYNPLAGGPLTAPRLVKIGWGEGMDRVGRFLQSNSETRGARVGTAYASTVAPFFDGDISEVTGDALDYVVLYIKQVQSGEPSPMFIRYYRQAAEPVYTVNLNGIRYAEVYPGPAVQPSLAVKPGLDHAILPKPVGFRPHTPYARLGEPLTVDVLWLADDPLPASPSLLTLESLSAFEFLEEHNHLDGTPEEPRQRTILAEAPALLTRWPGDLVVSRHQLTVPADLPRGRYALQVDGRPLGEIEARQFRLPDDMPAVEGAVFGGQIALQAYRYEPTADYVAVSVAWQALTAHLPDYTVFVQLLSAETGERVAGFDSQPLKGEWPTSQWVRGEVVVDRYLVAVPPDLPP